MKTQVVDRHGDVYVHKLIGDMEITPKYEQKENFTVAYGEVTGHHHTLYPKHKGGNFSVDTVSLDDFNIVHVKDGDSLTLKHQQHEPIVLTPGTYFFVVQEEYDSVTYTRKVLD